MHKDKQTKAYLMSKRQYLGYSQLDMARALGVEEENVLSWEDPQSSSLAPQSAFDYLEKVQFAQDEFIQWKLKEAEMQYEESNSKDIKLTCYANEADYLNDLPEINIPFTACNVNTILCARELEKHGYCVTIDYPKAC